MSIDLKLSYSSSSYDPSTAIVQVKRADEVARELIERSAKKSSNVSFIYKEMLRSVINAFSNFVVVDSEDKIIDVQCIHGTQERAIAKLTQDTNIILPIISIDQPKSNRDEKRQRYKPLVVSEKYTDPKTKRNHRLVSLVPAPVEIEYELTLWSKYKNDLDQITEQIHAKFNPDLELTTIFGTNIKLFIKEEATESNLIAADREDRILIRSFRLISSTYIPSPKFLMTSTGQIEDFNFDYEIEEAREIQSVNHLRTQQNGGTTSSQPAQSNYVSYGNVIFKVPYIDTNGISGLTEMPGELARPT